MSFGKTIGFDEKAPEAQTNVFNISLYTLCSIDVYQQHLRGDGLFQKVLLVSELSYVAYLKHVHQTCQIRDIT